MGQRQRRTQTPSSPSTPSAPVRRPTPPPTHQMGPQGPRRFTPSGGSSNTQLGGGPGLIPGLGLDEGTMLASAEDFGGSNSDLQDFIRGGGGSGLA